MSKIKVGSDFSGVGAFDQALMRLELSYETIFSCDMDNYARQTYIENYGEPQYYPENVYDRDIPKESLDIYMTSPPCQAFSLAGKRKGEGDKRGVLFYNSHEFIVKNRPRFFIFENVKGLLSDDGGKTFQRWIDFLAKSVNGTPIMFPHEESAGYHVYHGVLNSKDYGVPQNRERVFIVGIRDDQDNNFRFPKPQHLKERLKDVLEPVVDDKYFLSGKMLNFVLNTSFKEAQPVSTLDIAPCQTVGGDVTCFKVKSATKKGYEEAKEGDSINFSQPNSETRRGRVGKGVAQTLDTACNQGVLAGRIVGRNPDNPKSRKAGEPTQQQLELNKDTDVTNTISTVQKDNVIQLNKSIESNGQQPYQQNRLYDKEGISPAIQSNMGGDRMHNINTVRIRRLTPRECFRLQDFPDTFKMPCSDTQMYKQAGNSITVGVLAKIINNLSL